MSDVIGKIFCVLLAVLLLFIYPLVNTLEQQDITTREFVYSEATLFVDSVRNRGELTDEMLRELMNKLDATNNSYDVQLQHSHQSMVPIYLDPLDVNTFQNRFEVHEDDYFNKDILTYLESVHGPYKLTQGDSFKISIINQNKTLATKVLQVIYGSEMPTETIVITYGGLVK